MILILWLAFFLIPAFIGSGILSLLYSSNQEKKIYVSECVVLGAIFCMGTAWVAHMAGAFAGIGVRTLALWWLISLLLIGSVCGLYVALTKRKRAILAVRRSAQPAANQYLVLGFFLLVLLQMIFLYTKQNIWTDGDITVEMVNAFLAEGKLYSVNPLTGTAYVNPISKRFMIQGLPSMYAMIAAGFSVPAQLLVQHIIPVVVLAFSYFAYYRLSGAIYGNRMNKRYVFMLFVTLVFMVTDRAPYLAGYQAMHSAYLGSSILQLILLPYAMAMAIDKKWWQVAICGITAFCICNPLAVPAELENYFTDYKLLAVGIAYLLYEYFGKEKAQKQIFLWASFFLFPTALLAYAACELLTTILPANVWKEWNKKAVTIGMSIAVILIYIMLGNMGDMRVVDEFTAAKRSGYAEVLLVAGEDATVYGPRDLMQYLRMQDGDIKLPYGKDMWDEKSAAYDGDAYEMDLIAAYEWMQEIGAFDALASEATDLQLMPDAELTKQATEHVATLRGYGVNTFAFPIRVADEIIEELQSNYEEGAGAYSVALENYTVIRYE